MRQLNFCLIIALAATMFACNKPNGSGDPTKPNPDVKSFWESYNHLALLQLQGKVKKLTQGADYIEFNEAGNMLKTGSTDDDYSISYTYDDKNRLTQNFAQSYGGETYVYQYEYDNEGYFVPEHWMHIAETQLIPGLSRYVAMNAKETETENVFRFEDGKLLVFSEGWDEEQQCKSMILKATINYDGAYPVSCDVKVDERTRFYWNIKYYPNGMFKEVVEGRIVGDNNSEITTTYFKEHDTYLLRDRVITNVVEPYYVGAQIDHNIEYLRTDTYTYDSYANPLIYKNEDKNLTAGITNTYTEECTFTKFDEHNNWVESTLVRKQGEEVVEDSKLVRSLEYFD